MSGRIPALPPATCWLRFFFTWFLHEQQEEGSAEASSSSSSPPISPSFLQAGRTIVRTLVSALMRGLESESDPDTLLGYVAFLHANATRFVPIPGPTMRPSKLFCLHLALRVCDVVMTRDIIADKLMAPLPLSAAAPSSAASPSAASASIAQRKRRKLSSGGVGASQALPSLSLAGTAAAEDGSMDFSLDGTPLSTGGAELDELTAATADGLSGYALILSVLDAAYRVVEHMQGDEALMRRMLARQTSHADEDSSAFDGQPPPPQAASDSMLRSSSVGSSGAMEDDDEEEVVVESSGGGAAAATSSPSKSHALVDELMGVPASPNLARTASLNNDAANGMVATPVADEEFMTLHRSWAGCSRPILAYFPLPLLHGILGFLAYPYALPIPSTAQIALANESIPAMHSSNALLSSFTAYQHLINLLVPDAPAPQPHVVQMNPATTDGDLPALTLTAGASWLEDSSSIRWPLPSDTHAAAILARSHTPVLLLLALEVCAPNQLLSTLLHFGLNVAIVCRMMQKLDGWANYQLRLTQKQTGAPAASSAAVAGGGGLKTSGSHPSGLSLSPGMRELLNSLAALLQSVQLYQSLMEAQSLSTAPVPGHQLVHYLRSLVPSTLAAPDSIAPTMKQEATTAVNVKREENEDRADETVRIRTALRELLDCNVSHPSSLPWRASELLHRCALETPLLLLRTLPAAFDMHHCRLLDALPLLQRTLEQAYAQTSTATNELDNRGSRVHEEMAALLPLLLSHMSSALDERGTMDKQAVQSRALLEEWRMECEASLALHLPE
jgi:hypothetical protein